MDAAMSPTANYQIGEEVEIIKEVMCPVDEAFDAYIDGTMSYSDFMDAQAVLPVGQKLTVKGFSQLWKIALAERNGTVFRVPFKCIQKVEGAK